MELSRFYHSSVRARVLTDRFESRCTKKDVDVAMNLARQIYTSDFTVHDWLSDHKGMDARAEGPRHRKRTFRTGKRVLCRSWPKETTLTAGGIFRELLLTGVKAIGHPSSQHDPSA